MGTIRTGTTPAIRLEAAASILAAARTTDTRPVKDRLAAFERAHRAYSEAQRKVDAVEKQLNAARQTRDAVGGNWDIALGALKRGARAAADDGAPQLYASLFERPTRASGRNGKRAPAPAPEPPAEPAKPA